MLERYHNALPKHLNLESKYLLHTASFSLLDYREIGVVAYVHPPPHAIMTKVAQIATRVRNID